MIGYALMYSSPLAQSTGKSVGSSLIQVVVRM
jgi:hypothetical protein